MPLNTKIDRDDLHRAVDRVDPDVLARARKAAAADGARDFTGWLVVALISYTAESENRTERRCREAGRGRPVFASSKGHGLRA